MTGVRQGFYQEEAEEWLEEANDKQSEEGKRNAIARAQVYATLEVANAIKSLRK